MTPFRLEGYGLPALAAPGRWCQTAIIPRANVYGETDKARRDIALVLAIALTGIVLGVLLLLGALWFVRFAHKSLCRERRQLDEKRVRAAVRCMR